MTVKILAFLILLFGLGCFIVGVGSLQIIDTSVEIMRQMREAGSQTLSGVDLSTMRIVLYVNAILMTLIGSLSIASGIGMLMKKTGLGGCGWLRSC